MKPNLLFAGRVGSGKTHLSEIIANVLGSRWSSFGKTLKAIAVERGIQTSREHLQALGEQLVSSEPKALCCRVLAEAEPKGTQPIVIDGLRHRHIYDTLQKLLAPQPILIVYVDIRDDVRRGRLKFRDGLTDEQIQKLEEHSTEAEVFSEIRGIANIITDNSGSLEAAVSSVVAGFEVLSI
jgi:dephospho-CoA kinase